MKILIPVLVGSLIGYFTNWLAIKMLFKPHYEKKIFGFSIPLTPGLIPKERKRMARNIGQAVGEYILSTDTIIEAISDSENEKKIKSWISKKVENLRHDNRTLDKYLDAKVGKEYGEIKINFSGKVSGYILNFIRKDKFKRFIHKLIDENIGKYNTENLYKNIASSAKSFMEEVKNSDNSRIQIEKFMDGFLNRASNDDRTVAEVVPSDVFDSLDKYLLENKDQIGGSIREIFKDEDVREKIQYTMSNVIFDRSNKLLMAFISPDVISEKIFESLEKYIEKKETNDDILEIINFLVEKIKGKKLSDIAVGIGEILEEVSMKPVFNKLICSLLKDENIDKSVDGLVQILNKSESKNKDIVKSFLWKEIDKAIESEYTKAKVIIEVEDFVNKLGDKNISDIFTRLDDTTISSIYGISRNLFNRFAEHELPKIIEMLNVSKIVEDKINSFEIEYTEKLILDIARKELNQITRLGALLGGILGLLSPLLQFLY